jgi:hypothetical protein
MTKREFISMLNNLPDECEIRIGNFDEYGDLIEVVTKPVRNGYAYDLHTYIIG